MEALTSLIQEDAQQSMPPFDLWLCGRDDILTWWFGPGIGCQGSRVVPTISANGSPAFGQYKPTAGRRLRALGAAGARDRGRPHRRVHVLPRHGDGLPALRAAAAARPVAPTCVTPSARREPHERDERRRSAEAFRSRTGSRAAARRAAAGRARRRDRVRLDAGTSQSATAAPLPRRSAQTRSQSPGRSARAIGPRIANATVCGAAAPITDRTVGRPELIGSRPMSSADGPV